jgi:hypothetical protein
MITLCGPYEDIGELLRDSLNIEALYGYKVGVVLVEGELYLENRGHAMEYEGRVYGVSPIQRLIETQLLIQQQNEYWRAK